VNREQLEHAIRTACQIIQHDEIIVVGSQAILGTFDEDELPAEATASRPSMTSAARSEGEATASPNEMVESAPMPFDRPGGCCRPMKYDGTTVVTEWSEECRHGGDRTRSLIPWSSP
jgi:hypothetical protein